MPVATIQRPIPAFSSDMAVCSMATSLDINILDNGGREDGSFISGRSTLESDMLGYVARKAVKLANDRPGAECRTKMTKSLELVVQSSDKRRCAGLMAQSRSRCRSERD